MKRKFIIAGIIIIAAISILSYALSKYYNQQPYYVGERITLEPYQSIEQKIFLTKGERLFFAMFYNQIIPEDSEINFINATIVNSQGNTIYSIKTKDLFWECGGRILSPGINCTFNPTYGLYVTMDGIYELKIINLQNTTIQISYDFGAQRYTTSGDLKTTNETFHTP